MTTSAHVHFRRLAVALAGGARNLRSRTFVNIASCDVKLPAARDALQLGDVALLELKTGPRDEGFYVRKPLPPRVQLVPRRVRRC
jgi:hypothetical protein